MTHARRVGVSLVVAAFAAGASCGASPDENVEEVILTLERRALDEWSSGQPQGYARHAAEDVTYFDDIAAAAGVSGREAWRAYLASLEGKIPRHTYEIVDPAVQVYGDTAILTLHYHATTLDGTPLTRWKATSVYRRQDGEWRVVHAHWSTIKDTPPGAGGQ